MAVLILLLASACASQTKDTATPANPVAEQLEKYPGLLPEFGILLDKMSRSVELPQPRSQSKLLPLLPFATTLYLATPNYGEAAHQALAVFRDELKQSAVLRDWWTQGDMAKSGPELQNFVETFTRVSQYLGDEIVFSAQTGGANHQFLVAAEIRKPGLKAFLQQSLKDLPDKSRPNVRILDATELEMPAQRTQPPDLVVLVRPDLVIASADLETLCWFNSLLDAKSQNFPATAFGQRLAQAYQGGTSMVAAVNLHTILSQMPPPKRMQDDALERSGFKDVKYLVWQRKSAANQSISESELSFTGPRRGVAAWLAGPAKLGSQDFVSPKAVLAVTLGLKNLGEIFDDLKELSSSTNPKAFADIPKMEQAMGISLRDDLLGQLQGEITVELRGLAPQPTWSAILRVKDAEHLQRTLDKVLSQVPVQVSQFEEDGVHYYSLMVPAQQKATEVVYTIQDGYLIIAPSRTAAAETIAIHKSGVSLARSENLRRSLPPGHSDEASALLYEDATVMTAFRLRQVSAETADALASASTQPMPVTYRAYGEETAIRGVSSSGTADVGAMLIVAAVAIPNLLRARIAANEAAAAATLRTVNTAQVVYSSADPRRGYARDLATLGPDPRVGKPSSAEHAGLIDATLGNASCVADAWCTKSGYRFSLKAVCQERMCKEFVVVGMPLSRSTGTKSFCSTSDGVIRARNEADLAAPITVTECRTWEPLP